MRRIDSAAKRAALEDIKKECSRQRKKGKRMIDWSTLRTLDGVFRTAPEEFAFPV